MGLADKFAEQSGSSKNAAILAVAEMDRDAAVHHFYTVVKKSIDNNFWKKEEAQQKAEFLALVSRTFNVILTSPQDCYVKLSKFGAENVTMIFSAFASYVSRTSPVQQQPQISKYVTGFKDGVVSGVVGESFDIVDLFEEIALICANNDFATIIDGGKLTFKCGYSAYRHFIIAGMRCYISTDIAPTEFQTKLAASKRKED